MNNCDGDMSIGRNIYVGGRANVSGSATVNRNLKVKGWLDAANIVGPEKGMFATEEALKQAFPKPQPGWWALVGATLPANIYIVSNGHWADSGNTGTTAINHTATISDLQEKLETLEDKYDGRTTACYDSTDFNYSGTYLSIEAEGYIKYASGAINLSQITASNNFTHAKIPCKRGDVFIIVGKGGSEARLFMQTDYEGAVKRNANANADYTAAPMLLGCYSDGYLIVNARRDEPHSLFKIDTSKFIANTELDISQFVVFTQGYVNITNGQFKTSDQNVRTGVIPLMGFNAIRLTVNVSTAPDSSVGIVFFDSEGKFLCGKQCEYGESKGIIVREYTVPAGAAHACSAIYAEHSDDFIVSLINRPQQAAISYLIGSPALYVSPSTAKETSLPVTAAQLYAEYDNIATTHPFFFRRAENLCDIIVSSGQNYEVRQYVLRFNSPFLIDHEPSASEIVDADSNKWDAEGTPMPKVLICCGMHGNEKLGCWGALLAIQDILKSNEPWAAFIKSNIEIRIVPCLNPHGFTVHSRYNANGLDLNRASARAETERKALMQWISAHSNAIALIDMHGTQGRYVYVPVLAGSPIAKWCHAITARLAAALHSNWQKEYEKAATGYGSTYSPFLLAKSTADGTGLCSQEMLDRFGMAQFTIETPSSISTGAISHADARSCKFGKDLLVNFLQLLPSYRK